MPKPMVKLTPREKETIRNSPCGRCGGVPPFEDGSRCHPHRIIPGCEGGEYVEGNVTPRCAECHDIEHGGNGKIPLIAATRAAVLSISPAQRRVNGRKGARVLWDGMTAKERKAFVREQSWRKIVSRNLRIVRMIGG